MYICVHSYIHSHIHTYIHTHTHMHTHAFTHMYTHTRTHAHTHTRTHAHTHRYTRIHTHTQTHSHKRTYARTHVHTRSCARVCTCVWVFVCISGMCNAGQFFGVTIFMLSLSSALTVFVMKMHFSGEHGDRVPTWLRRLVLVRLARLVRLRATSLHPLHKVYFFVFD